MYTGHILIWDIMVELDFIISSWQLLFLILELMSVFNIALSMYNFIKHIINTIK